MRVLLSSLRHVRCEPEALRLILHTFKRHLISHPPCPVAALVAKISTRLAYNLIACAIGSP